MAGLGSGRLASAKSERPVIGSSRKSQDLKQVIRSVTAERSRRSRSSLKRHGELDALFQQRSAGDVPAKKTSNLTCTTPHIASSKHNVVKADSSAQSSSTMSREASAKCGVVNLDALAGELKIAWTAQGSEHTPLSRATSKLTDCASAKATDDAQQRVTEHRKLEEHRAGEILMKHKLSMLPKETEKVVDSGDQVAECEVQICATHEAMLKAQRELKVHEHTIRELRYDQQQLKERAGSDPLAVFKRKQYDKQAEHLTERIELASGLRDAAAKRVAQYGEELVMLHVERDGLIHLNV
mmetsp:Transcript_13737/g.36873  ORF Transcript_13737/g.36873 Transcript_13737/m.36873 type:complete len:297 (+) Transcript_13737:422-1312(+)